MQVSVIGTNARCVYFSTPNIDKQLSPFRPFASPLSLFLSSPLHMGYTTSTSAIPFSFSRACMCATAYAGQ